MPFDLHSMKEVYHMNCYCLATASLSSLAYKSDLFLGNEMIIYETCLLFEYWWEMDDAVLFVF
jgi:hypothetical protein